MGKPQHIRRTMCKWLTQNGFNAGHGYGDRWPHCSAINTTHKALAEIKHTDGTIYFKSWYVKRPTGKIFRMCMEYNLGDKFVWFSCSSATIKNRVSGQVFELIRKTADISYNIHAAMKPYKCNPVSTAAAIDFIDCLPDPSDVPQLLDDVAAKLSAGNDNVWREYLKVRTECDARHKIEDLLACMRPMQIYPWEFSRLLIGANECTVGKIVDKMGVNRFCKACCLSGNDLENYSTRYEERARNEEEMLAIAVEYISNMKYLAERYPRLFNWADKACATVNAHLVQRELMRST